MLKLTAVLMLTASMLAQANSELFREKIEGKSDYIEAGDLAKAQRELNVELVLQTVKTTLDSELRSTLESDTPEASQLTIFLTKLRENLSNTNVKVNNKKFGDGDFKRALILARENRLIDDVFFYLATEEQAISLKRYVSLREAFSTAENPELPKDKENPLTKRVYKEKYKGGGKVSPRLRLYFSFTPEQVQTMASLLDICMGRIAASEAKIVFSYENQADCTWCVNGVDEINLPPTEKYKAALNLFELMFEEAKTTEPLIGSEAKFIDVVTAAYETNTLSAQKIDVVTNFEGLASPRLTAWQKISRITYTLGRMALLGMPATQAYAIVPILLLESIHASKQPRGHAGRLFR